MAVADETKGLIVTRNVLMLDLYARVAEEEGLTLREFLLKYGLARKANGG